MTEYVKIVKESRGFRENYAYRMQDIINQLEKNMRYNIDMMQNCVIEFANQGLKQTEESINHIEKLRKVRFIENHSLRKCKIWR